MSASADISGKFALDVQAVNGLRAAGKKDGQAGLEAAARQFEALFLNMMLKSMREATPKDSLMDSEQSRLYISMLDQQLSQSMAARGVGLAEVMMRQLRHNLPPETEQPMDDVASERSAPLEQPKADSTRDLSTRATITDATISCDSVSGTTDGPCKRSQPDDGHTSAVHAWTGRA